MTNNWKDDQTLWNIIGPTHIDELDEAGYVVVRKGRKPVYEGGPCPHCGSDRLTTDHDDEKFLPRVGCLDCNVWLTEVRLRGGE